MAWFCGEGLQSTSIDELIVSLSFWGVAKLVKAADFDSAMRGFESFLPSQYDQCMLNLRACSDVRSSIDARVFWQPYRGTGI